MPRRKSDELKKQDDEPIYLTEEGFKQLEEKLARLKRVLPGFIEETQRTAAYGDRSDNAEYKEAKSTPRRTNWQILSIQDQIKRVAIIKSGPSASGTVRLGSTVVLKAEGPERLRGAEGPEPFGDTQDPRYSRGTDGAKKIFQILGPHETDPANGCISYQSPLGSALMNHKKGDIVTIQTKSGSGQYRILEVR